MSSLDRAPVIISSAPVHRWYSNSALMLLLLPIQPILSVTDTALMRLASGLSALASYPRRRLTLSRRHRTNFILDDSVPSYVVTAARAMSTRSLAHPSVGKSNQTVSL